MLINNAIQLDDVGIVKIQSAYAIEETLLLPNSIAVLKIPDKVIYPFDTRFFFGVYRKHIPL